MSQTKRFNFNNEQASTTITEHDNGRITVHFGGETGEFESIQEFAEFYANARHVRAESLKNWVLVEDGDTYSFVQRAASGAIDPDKLIELTTSLTAAGLAPDQINKIINDTINATTTTTTTETPTVQNNVVDDIEEEILNIIHSSGKPEITSYYILEGSNARTIHEAALNLYQNVAEALYDDEYVDYDNDEIIEIIVNDKISKAKDQLKETYLHIPETIAIAIDRDAVDTLADGTPYARKKFFAAKVGGKDGIEVDFVNVLGDSVRINTVLSDASVLDTTSKIAFDEGRIVIISR